jgi:hypothetical protein
VKKVRRVFEYLPHFEHLYVSEALIFIETIRHRITFLARVVLMDTGENDNSGDDATGAQAASAETDLAQLHDTANQLQASVSRLAQEDEGSLESLVTVIKQVGAQLRTTDASVQKNCAEIDKLATRLRNYRS